MLGVGFVQRALTDRRIELLSDIFIRLLLRGLFPLLKRQIHLLNAQFVLPVLLAFVCFKYGLFGLLYFWTVVFLAQRA
jgi:hypothetical protein